MFFSSNLLVKKYLERTRTRRTRRTLRTHTRFKVLNINKNCF
jgi:hypothetical protein